MQRCRVLLGLTVLMLIAGDTLVEAYTSTAPMLHFAIVYQQKQVYTKRHCDQFVVWCITKSAIALLRAAGQIQASLV